MSILHKRDVTEFTRHLKGFITFTILIVWIQISVARVIHVNRCPTCETEWTERAMNMSCDMGNGLHYHCILDTEDNLVELCLAKRPISPGKEGCPIVFLTGNTAIHEGENSPCPSNNKFCPMSSKLYYTNELYRFPICFLNVSAREDYRGEHCSVSSTVESKKPDASKKIVQCDCVSTNCLTWVPVIFLTASMAINIVLGCLLCRKKTNKGKSLSCNGQQSTLAPLTPGIGRMEES